MKIPKWAFEKFPESDSTLGTQMKSVGEVMAIGRTFKEAFFKGFDRWRPARGPGSETIDKELIRQKLITPNPDRIPYLLQASVDGSSIRNSWSSRTSIPWFLNEMKEIADITSRFPSIRLKRLPPDLLREAKARRIFRCANRKAGAARQPRRRRGEARRHGSFPVYKRVDTCAAEFESYTPYFYSTYEEEDEAEPTNERRS